MAAAEKFGFNEKPTLPAAKASTIPKDLKDSLAVGAAAIGQERTQATPLEMASRRGDDRQPRRARAARGSRASGRRASAS